MLLPLLLAAADAPADEVAAVLARYQARTSAGIACKATDDQSEILVCARRDADRDRVSFVRVVDDDDPKREGVPHERARLMDGKTYVCGITGPFLTHCGAVGVSMTVSGDGVVETERGLAP